jgi:hypothetical protein
LDKIETQTKEFQGNDGSLLVFIETMSRTALYKIKIKITALISKNGWSATTCFNFQP